VHTVSEQQKIRDYIEVGFRDLQLADIKHADDADVRMGTFQLCAAFLDALALTYSAGLTLPGKDAGKWDAFVSRFFTGATRTALVGKYGGFRCLLLHNFSASGLAFIHGHPKEHLRSYGGRTILNRESFVAEVETAFNAFHEAVRTDAELRTRALRWLDKHPPMGVWFLEDAPAPAPAAPVATAMIVPPLWASYATSATSITASPGTGTRAPIGTPARAPKFAPTVKSSKTKRKRTAKKKR
jgi:hypothetical protein